MTSLTSYPVLIAAALVFLLVLGLAGFFSYRWLKRRSARRKEQALGPPKLARNALVQIFRDFERELPSSVRNSLYRLPIAVVLGENGAGASRLIDANVDWRSQQVKFVASHTHENLLKIHLGSQALVLELAPSLVLDYSREAQQALHHLWDVLPRQITPSVLICVDAATLQSRPDDDLRRLGALLRGKINILSEHYARPIPTMVHLSGMDDIPGYLDFAKLMRRLGIGAQINLTRTSTAQALTNCLANFERYLPMALSFEGGSTFNGIVRYLEDAPPLLTTLAPLLEQLQQSEKASYTPMLRELSFAATNGEAQLGRPLTVPATYNREVRSQQKLTILKCAGALAMVAIPLLVLYAWTWQQLETIESADLRQSEASLRSTIGPVIKSINTAESYWPLLNTSFVGLRKRIVANLEHALANDRPHIINYQQLEGQAHDFQADLQRVLSTGIVSQAKLGELKEDAHTLETHIWLLGLQPRKNRPALTSELPALLQVIALVKASTLQKPNLTQSSYGLGALLEDIVDMENRFQKERRALKTETPIRLSLIGENAVIEPQKWARIQARSSIPLIVNQVTNRPEVTSCDYHDPTSEHEAFFAIGEQYPPIRSKSILGGKDYAKVSSQYTRKVLVEVINPILADFEQIVEDLGTEVLGATLPRLETFVEKQIGCYARGYARQYADYLDSYLAYSEDFLAKYSEYPADQVTADDRFTAYTSDAALEFLEAAATPSSRLGYMLDVIANNVVLPEDSNSRLDPLRQELAIFQSIAGRQDQRLIFEAYQQILRNLYDDVRSQGASQARCGDSPRCRGNRAVASAALSEPLTEIYYTKLEQWFDEVGMPNQFRRLFQLPIDTSDYYAWTTLENSIDAKWKEIRAKVSDLTNRFPLNRRAAPDHDVEIDELESILNPKSGEFWTLLRDQLGQVLIEDNHDWELKPEVAIRIEPPAAMLSTINKLSELCRLLWDENGNPKPLDLAIRPLPLPRQSYGDEYVTLAYLKMGTNVVFAFNQAPSATRVQWQWWRKSPAEVGMEFSRNNEQSPRRRTLSVQPSPWSLFYLLREGEFDADGIALWSLPIHNQTEKTTSVRFRFESDPWSPFEVSG
jgi:hypothetical protein